MYKNQVVELRYVRSFTGDSLQKLSSPVSAVILSRSCRPWDYLIEIVSKEGRNLIRKECPQLISIEGSLFVLQDQICLKHIRLK